MLQLRIESCEQSQVDTISEFLEEHGALAITLADPEDDPILEPAPGETPLWSHVSMMALFDNMVTAEQAEQALAKIDTNLITSMHAIPEQDWERVCLEDIKPQCFGDCLWICPSWIEPPEPSAAIVTLDPGLAFGTGTHPTTALCLFWLAKTPMTGKTLIDYGCGSGILALGALKLGADHVQAVDIDAQALIATENNARLNEVNPSQLTITSPEALHGQVDIIMANILLAPLLTLKTTFREKLKPGGTLIVSGLLATQVDTLIAEYTTFKHVSSVYQDNWGFIVFQRD